MRIFTIGTLFVIGFLIILFLWPKSVELPKLGKVQEPVLEEVRGKEFNMKGKPLLVMFFYTKCPDICPTTMADLKGLQQIMKEKGVSEDQYLILSITLDPDYDTKERILQYKEAFQISSNNWLFLRGSEQETKRFADRFSMFYEKDEAGYVTHSTSMYLVDGHQQIRSHHDMAVGDQQVNIEKVADHLLQLMDSL
ncbi:SCO family protein [Bacillus sp. REN10]|uniref:SCO family protein n=1 Tax=Bacillus sp. REN10 TaxID=2782541 RepID=UPI00193BCF9E|nr:SCO family protein [Bacillus sp. REN10]